MKKAPLCKGSSAEGGEGLFFFYNPSVTRSRDTSPYTGEAKINHQNTERKKKL